MANSRKTPSLGALAAASERRIHLVALGLGGLLILLVAGATAAILRYDYRQVVSLHSHETASLARVLEEHADRTIGEVDLILRHLGDMEAARELSAQEDARSDVADLAQRLPQIRGLAILDSQGHPVTSAAKGGFAMAADLGRSPWFAALKANARAGLFISPPVREPGGWTVYLARRLTSPDGRFRGVAAAALDPNYFGHFYAAMDLGRGSVVAVVQDNGRILFRAPRAAIGENVSTHPLFTRELPRAQAGTYISAQTMDQVPRILSYRHLTTYPLVVVVGQSVAEVMTDWHHRADTALAYAVLLGLTLAASTWWMARHAVEARRAQAVLRAAAEGTMEALVLLDAVPGGASGPDFVIGDLNRRARALLGRRREDLLGQRLDLLPPFQDHPPLRQQCRRVYEEGRMIEDEVEATTPAGAPVWLRLQVVPLPGGIALAARDITGRKTTELALAQSEARLKKAQAIAQIGSWERDLKARRIFWSDEVFRIFGVSPHHFIPTPESFLDLVHPDDREHVTRALSQALSGGVTVEYRVVRADGQERRIQAQAETILDEAGEPWRITGIIQDITERRRASEALRESEERFRALVQLSPDAIIVHRDGIIRFANAAAYQIFRVEAGQTLLGRAIHEFAHPRDRGSVLHRIEEPPHSPGPFEERYVRLNGEIFDSEVMATTITFEGQPAREVVIRDITPRKQMQTQLVQAAKLATLGEMAAGLTHELSQPLNVIRMGAEGAILMMERKRADEEYCAAQFSLIAGQTRRMAEIIDHVRIFSRRDSGEVQRFDVLACVNAAAELMRHQVRDERLDIVIASGLSSFPASGRPVQMEQVLVNLIANALDSVREQARRLRPQRHKGAIVIRAEERGSTLHLSVSDNGTGIPPHVLERLFEPFFTTKDVGRGTGLGLSVSYGIIAGMGGTLSADNAPEGGARFLIEIPRAAQGAVAQPAPALPAPPSLSEPRHGHILVVDDEPEAVAAMAGFLAQTGYRVTTAGSGNAAFDAFSADPADLVITDLRMPDGDGSSLIEQLRDFDPLLPIVVVTGHLGPTESLGLDPEDDRHAVIAKPVGLEQLGRAVEHLLTQPL